MWDIPSYRLRAYARQMRKTNAQSNHKPRLHIKRVPAEMMIYQGFARPHRLVKARIVSADLTPRSLYLFSTDPLEVGQEVALNIKDPTSFYVRGQVSACFPVVLTNRIITETNYPYRLRIDFRFQSEGEKEAVRLYCDAFLADKWLRSAA